MRLLNGGRLLWHFREVYAAVQGMRTQASGSATESLQLCVDCLLQYQAQGNDAGYAASFGLVTGWSSSYIETTGYIVPTMFDLAVALADHRCRDSALRAGEWLLSVQQSDGSFTDIDHGQPQIFDTGQVLMGLCRLYEETGDDRFRVAAIQAGDWLVRQQDPDGSWTRAAFIRGKAQTYHTRCAAALIGLGDLTSDPRYAAAGAANLSWAAERQLGNGFFTDAELHEGESPVLHTMVYVLEGFLEAYKRTGDPGLRESLLRGAEALKRRNLDQDVVLYSQYDSDFAPGNTEKCIPGLAQWASLCMDLHRVTEDEGYLECAVLSLFYLKSKQIRAAGALRGALPASIPVWGRYHPLTYPNWAVKFFADALLKYRSVEWPAWKEQELWARKCFQLQLDGGGWDRFAHTIDPMDERILDRIEAALADPNKQDLRVLDLGSGKGRYMRALSDRRPTWMVAGVDPFYFGAEFRAERGSAYAIPHPDATFDAVYATIALQHVSDLDRALDEIRRVTKPGGTLVIADRNLLSGRGLLKPYHEIRGRWIYPWDSPFRERWYTARQWNRMLTRAGFTVRDVSNMRNPGDRGRRRALRMNDMLIMHAVRSS